MTAAACRDGVSLALPDQPASARGSAGAAASPDLIPDEYIVTFRDGVADVPGLARQLVAQQGGTLRFTYTAALKGFAAHLSAAAATALQRNPQVTRVEQDAWARGSDVELNPDWGLDRIDQRLRPMDLSYSYANRGEGVSVYILDTGIRTTHVEFGGRAFGAYTAVNDGNGTSDCNGHGTHVAGTVGGQVYGVAKAVRLYSVRVLDCTGYGPYSGIIAGVDWVTKNRVLPAVANMSLGGSKSSTLNSAVQNSIKAGVVYAIAAGNSSADACNYSPSSTPEALTVGATWNGDGMSGYSNFGPCVDLFAPGSAIRSAGFVDDTSSAIKGGTSMASPHVAGVAALYLSANPAATPAEVAAAIVGGATPNVLASVPSGTANLLLYSAVAPPASVPPSDTTMAPPPPPASDLPPTVAFTYSCPHGKCAFDASGSSDDHGIASYAWNFGDGSASVSGAALIKVSHSYSAAGSYTVTLTVTDTAGQRSTRSVVLTFKKL